MGYNNSSESELDCRGLIQVSDSDDASVITARTFDKFHAENAGLSSTCSDSKAQDLVNQKPLEQLKNIGKRLDKLEQSNCKRNVDKTKLIRRKYYDTLEIFSLQLFLPLYPSR